MKKRFKQIFSTLMAALFVFTGLQLAIPASAEEESRYYDSKLKQYYVYRDESFTNWEDITAKVRLYDVIETSNYENHFPWGQETERLQIVESDLSLCGEFYAIRSLTFHTKDSEDVIVIGNDNQGGPLYAASSSYCFHALNSVIFEDGPGKIYFTGFNTFSNTAVSSVEIPSNVYFQDEYYDGEYHEMYDIMGPSFAIFSSCEKLTTAKLGCKEKFFNLFSSCLNLKTVNFIPSANIIEISDGAFKNCESLSSMSVPPTIKTICKNAYYNCYSLPAAKIPPTVTTIGENAFMDCTFHSVTIPATVTAIGEKAFGYVDEYIGTDQKSTNLYEKSKQSLGTEDVSDGKIVDFTIYGTQGTAAETYAKENGFRFVAIDGINQRILVKPVLENVLLNESNPLAVTVKGSPEQLTVTNQETSESISFPRADAKITGDGEEETWTIPLTATEEFENYDIVASYASGVATTDGFKLTTKGSYDSLVTTPEIADSYSNFPPTLAESYDSTVTQGRHTVTLQTGTDICKVQFLDPAGNTQTYATNYTPYTDENGIRTWKIPYNFSIGEYKLIIRTRAHHTTFSTTDTTMNIRVVY